jgi:Predicted membrane protein
LRGAFWGSLIGWLFLNPLLGAAVGSASGALAGKLSEYGVSDTFVKSLAQKIQPGAAAVFALLKDVTLDKVKADLAKLGGTVLYTNLSLDDELKLVEALSKAKEPANG